MISTENLALQRGGRELFSGVSLKLHRGHRYGLTGANGTGKSSFFGLILGELEADAGELSVPPGAVIAHVAQETPGVSRAAIEYVIDGDTRLRALEERIAGAEGEKLAELLAEYETLGGYAARSRAATLMHGLGFGPSRIDAPVSSFSGGWRMRLNLARALMQRSDLLLLDEPTNHLDLDAVLWLENWLLGYEGILLLISHDREFLDAVATDILHLEQGAITASEGNWSAFEKQRAARLEQQAAMHKKQQREIAHLQRFIDRFRAKATKARQAQSRIKALARMEVIAAAHVDSPFHFSFFPAARAGDPLLKLEAVSAGYGDNRILENLDFQLSPGSRVGLLGPNGAGKSTLIKLLAGELPAMAGERIEAQGLKIGYFAQHQLEQLDAEASALLHLQRSDSGDAAEQQMRDFLGGFGFQGERAEQPVAPFSGGEKARLVLALLVWQKPNLLLLDEPTNHLDLEMRHAITVALQAFEGAMVIVSHDRHLLRTCADAFYLVHDRQCERYDGDLDDYRQLIAEREKQANPERPAHDRKQQRRDAAARRRQQQPIRNKLKSNEREMAGLQQRLTELERRLADDALYQPDAADALKQALAEQAECSQRLAAVEEQWLTLQEQLEALDATNAP